MRSNIHGLVETLGCQRTEKKWSNDLAREIFIAVYGFHHIWQRTFQLTLMKRTSLFSGGTSRFPRATRNSASAGSKIWVMESSNSDLEMLPNVELETRKLDTYQHMNSRLWSYLKPVMFELHKFGMCDHLSCGFLWLFCSMWLIWCQVIEFPKSKATV